VKYKTLASCTVKVIAVAGGDEMDQRNRSKKRKTADL
jgi:hypothetical protein